MCFVAMPGFCHVIETNQLIRQSPDLLFFFLLVYHGIFLEAMTAGYFKEMVSSKLSVPLTSISSVLMQHAPGILINVDDLVGSAIVAVICLDHIKHSLNCASVYYT